MEIEDTIHYLLYCQYISYYRYDLMNSVKSIIPNFESLTENNRITDSPFDENKNKIILETTTNYLKTFERFSGFLFE